MRQKAPIEDKAKMPPLMSPRLLGVLACLVNFGMLLFNLGFTRAGAIAAFNPQVFSEFGQAMILVWGIAFLLAGLGDGDRPSYIWLAFSLEKAMYVGSWLLWLKEIPVPEDMSSLDFIAPLFHLIYGPIDFVFLLLFLQQGLASFRAREEATAELKRA